MQKINPNLSINSFFCDFSVQDSIRECADKIKNDLKAIDLLINNAGVVNTEYSETIDGIEKHLQSIIWGTFFLQTYC